MRNDENKDEDAGDDDDGDFGDAGDGVWYGDDGAMAMAMALQETVRYHSRTGGSEFESRGVWGSEFDSRLVYWMTR